LRYIFQCGDQLCVTYVQDAGVLCVDAAQKRVRLAGARFLAALADRLIRKQGTSALAEMHARPNFRCHRRLGTCGKKKEVLVHPQESRYSLFIMLLFVAPTGQ
jgi:hypothetical protein